MKPQEMALLAIDQQGGGPKAVPGGPTPGDLAGLARQIDAIADLLASADEVVSVLLMGSAARDELAGARVEGRFELFSDLELMVVTRGHPGSALRRGLADAAARVGAGFGYRSPLFHVDLAFRARRRLASLPPIIFTHELAARGRVLRGPDLRAEIRPVDLHNLDRRQTHAILMRRLWAMAEGLPRAWVAGAPLDAIARRSLGVVLHRNPLDLPTVLLPEAGLLMSSYRERVACWRARPELPFRAALDAGLGRPSGDYLGECLALRAAAAEAPDPVAAHREALAALEAGLAWLDARYLGRVFDERPRGPGQWRAWLRQAVQLAQARGPRAAAAWARAPRQARLAAGLVDLHRALAARLAGDAAAAAAALDRAEATLEPIAGPEASRTPSRASSWAPGDASAERWLAARRLAGRAFWRTVRLGDPAAWEPMERRLAWSGGAG